MKMWTVRIPVYAAAVYEVEAEDEKDAIDRAYEIGLPSMCQQCANGIEVNDFADDCDPLAEESIL